MPAGTLLLIPSPLGVESPPGTIPDHATQALRGVDLLLVENPRTTRRYLARLGLGELADRVAMHVLSEHTSAGELAEVMAKLRGGATVGVLSEAGCPVVADPGAELARRCHQQGIRVEARTGPSSVILALMASGFSGQRFSFRGYLPIQTQPRIHAIREMERRAGQGETQIFMETPYRNVALLRDLMGTCRPQTMLCVACDLTTPREYVRTVSVRTWGDQEPPIHKRPALFLLGR